VKQNSAEFGLRPEELRHALPDHKVIAAQESMILEIAIELSMR
jgi:hypothetical protein